MGEDHDVQDEPSANYWDVRKQFMEALKTQDDEWLKDLLLAFPDVGKNLVNQAKNDKRSRNRSC